MANTDKMPITSSDETPIRMNALRPAVTEANQSDQEIRRLRILLLVFMLAETISVFVPRFYAQWQGEFRFLPQILIGFVCLAVILALHLAAQRKILQQISTALVAATSYVGRLEQVSLIDSATQLFNRRYLNELFNHQLKWLSRTGKAATLMLLEVIPNEQGTAVERIIIEAAYILRSNFRGSDYVVRYSTDQFLVIMPDTDDQQAQVALSRLIDKIDQWNSGNDKRDMALCLTLNTCVPDGSIWDRIGELEEKMRDKGDRAVRRLIRLNRNTSPSNASLGQESLVQ